MAASRRVAASRRGAATRQRRRTEAAPERKRAKKPARTSPRAEERRARREEERRAEERARAAIERSSPGEDARQTEYEGMVGWFPGHMARAVRQLGEQLGRAQLVLEVRDARVPFSAENPEIDAVVEGKRRLLVLNKADLVRPDEAERAVRYFRERLGRAAVAVSASSPRTMRGLRDAVVEAAGRNKFRTVPTVAVVVGLPNVGKSSVINALKGSSDRRKAGNARVGGEPGVTRHMSGFHVSASPPVFVIDTPGIMVPRFERSERGYRRALRLALTGSMRDHLVGFDLLAQTALDSLNAAGDHAYAAELGLPGPTESAAEMLAAVARQIAGARGTVVTPPEQAAREERLERLRAAASDGDEEAAEALAREGARRAARPSGRERHNRALLADGELTTEYITRSAEYVLSRYRAGRLGRHMLDEWPADA